MTEKDSQKKNNLFLLLGAFFLTNLLVAEFIGVKIFSLEKTLGIKPIVISLLGSDLSFNLTSGVILWPVVFVMTDIVNEYFGKKGVQKLTLIGSAMILYSFAAIYLSMQTTPADFFVTSRIKSGIPDMDIAYKAIFGQGLFIISGSLTAFLVGQLVDVFTFHKLKKITGNNHIWIRATGSTLVSQLIDSFVVLFIAFYFSGVFPLKVVLAIGVVNYIFKFVAAIALTPAIYLAHKIVDNYLGKELAEKMVKESSF